MASLYRIQNQVFFKIFFEVHKSKVNTDRKALRDF